MNDEELQKEYERRKALGLDATEKASLPPYVQTLLSQIEQLVSENSVLKAEVQRDELRHKLEAAHAAAHATEEVLKRDITILEQKLQSSEKKSAAMRDVLGLGNPWPLVDVLISLYQAGEHLMHTHDCDCQGHETIRSNIERAKSYVSGLSALSTDAGKGYGGGR